jgi:hypothetical protein
MPTDIHILSGCSGSGKSTEVERIRKRYANRHGIASHQVVVCSADYFFLEGATWDRLGNPTGGKYVFDPTKLGEAHAYCKRRFVEAVRRKGPLIIVDNTNTTVKEIEPYVYVARDYDVEKVFLTTVMEDPIVAHARNCHNVPLHVIQAQAKRIDERRIPRHWNLRESKIWVTRP